MVYPSPEGSQRTLLWPWPDVLQMQAAWPGGDTAESSGTSWNLSPRLEEESEAPGGGSTRNEKKQNKTKNKKKEGFCPHNKQGEKAQSSLLTGARLPCWM